MRRHRRIGAHIFSLKKDLMAQRLALNLEVPRSGTSRRTN
jgi:hypothetical protein